MPTPKDKKPKKPEAKTVKDLPVRKSDADKVKGGRTSMGIERV